jgi:Putative zinc-finger
MNPISPHQEVEELIPGAALETLDGDELARVLAHVRDCAECGRLLDEYRTVLGIMALGLRPEPLAAERSVRLKSRLLERARSQQAGRRPKQNTAGSSVGAADRWTGWAVAAGLAGVLLIHHGFHRPVAYGWVVAGVLAILLVGFGVYAGVQRRRVTALEERWEHDKADSSAE